MLDIFWADFVYFFLFTYVSKCRKFVWCCHCATGREIFVGLSTRTNMLGAQSVGRAFPEYPTTIVHVNPPAIHLKDYISMAGPEVMTVGKSEAAQRTFSVSSSCRPAFTFTRAVEISD